MDAQTLSELLQPFFNANLSESQLSQLSTYLELLLKWNRKMNLTAVREPEEIVKRHFGESLFAAGVLGKILGQRTTLLDFGSGAGFPGLPVKIALPALQVTLAESQRKKAMFLREACRSLALAGIEVFAGRAEQLNQQFDVVTMRAVDEQESLLTAASKLIAPGGFLVLMLGTQGIKISKAALPGFRWQDPVQIPNSEGRWVLTGEKTSSTTQIPLSSLGNVPRGTSRHQ